MALLETESMQSRLQRSIFAAFTKLVVELGYSADPFVFPETPEGEEQFYLANQIVKQEKGYYIELFGNSSARNKKTKDCPRIVIFTNRILNGDVGANPGKIYTMGADGRYTQSLLPSRSSHVVFAIHLISNNTRQDVLLNAILSQVLSDRRFLTFYDEPDRYFFIEQSSYNDLEDPDNNIIERAFFYTVRDVFLAEDDVLPGTISPILEINLKVNNEDKTQISLLLVNRLPYKLPFKLLT